jgi:hypothetical protein
MTPLNMHATNMESMFLAKAETAIPTEAMVPLTANRLPLLQNDRIYADTEKSQVCTYVLKQRNTEHWTTQLQVAGR